MIFLQLRANALIKRGSMYMQQQQPQMSTQDFNMAAEIDSQNADVYHHRGQVRLIHRTFLSFMKTALMCLHYCTVSMQSVIFTVYLIKSLDFYG